MSSTCSAGSAAFPLDLKEPECVPSNLSSLTPTAAPSSPSTGPMSPATTTFDPFTLPLDLPMSSAGDSPARTSATQESVPDWMANVLGCGANIGALLARYDRNSSSWKMSQLSLFEDCSQSSETLPRCGTTRNGACWELTPLDRRSIVSDSGWWHTPTTRDFKGQSGLGNRQRRGRGSRLHIANLCDQLVDIGRPDLIRSYTFREWLMGLPIGHTACDAWVTQSSRKSPKSSGEPSWPRAGGNNQ
jgi:hypothetical protein